MKCSGWPPAIFPDCAEGPGAGNRLGKPYRTARVKAWRRVPNNCKALHAPILFSAPPRTPPHGADRSHRGGLPGFVRVLDNGVLRIPDYNGNSMFNSIGNFLVSPQGGLLFPDDGRRVLLQMNGTVEMFWDQPHDDGFTGGTGRFWEFTVERWRRWQASRLRSARSRPRSGWSASSAAPAECGWYGA